MFSFILVFIVPLSTLLSNEYYKGDALVKEGVYAFYNYDFDKAVQVLDEARVTYPEHPGVHFIWAAARWVRAQANSPVDETYKTLENDLQIILPIYEALELKFDYDPMYRLYRGSAIGLTARVSLGKKQWLRTLYRAYKGFVIINDVATNYPELADAQLPIGIVEYYSGISNRLLTFAAGFYDLNPSKDSGLQKISVSADRGTWSWIESKAILSNLYLWVEDEPILAVDYTKSLVQNFPNNFYFNLLYLEALIRTGDLSVSAKFIEKMEEKIKNLTERQKEWFEPYLYYEKALLEFQKLNFEGALDLLSFTIENYSAELDIVLGNAFLLEGMSHDKLYNRSKAKESYYNCIYLDNFSGSINQAKLYLKKPYRN